MKSSKFPQMTRRQFLQSAGIVLAASALPYSWLRQYAQAAPTAGGQIIADHSVVTRYSQIPQTYIDLVKQMLVSLSGESHSRGYRYGMNLLAAQDARFAAQTFVASNPAPPPVHNPGDPKLRFGGLRRYASGWTGTTGEATFYTNSDAIEWIKNTIQYSHTNGNPLAAIGFGWCWDACWHNGPTNGSTPNELDPVHHVHWCGASEGGPEGDRRWGLNAEDQALTGNSVCMDTYLNAVEAYRTFSAQNGFACTPFFTTGPVDGYSGESGVQRELKHDYMRAFVRQDVSRVLFDYADILCWNDGGQQNILTWNDGGNPRPYAHIHPDNDDEYDGGEGSCHISQTGCIRLAKAMWWMLARLAGWDDGSPTPTATHTATPSATPGPSPTPTATPKSRMYLPIVEK